MEEVSNFIDYEKLLDELEGNLDVTPKHWQDLST